MEWLSGLLGAGANLLGGILGRQTTQSVAQQNIAAQQDFAKHGIQWKVDDARAAGINPLVALGANTSSFSNIAGSNDLGAGVSAAGQDLSRAAMATAAQQTRAADLEAKLAEAKIANVNADTARMMMIASNLARTHGAAGTPVSGVPLPAPDPRTADTLPGTQDYRFGKSRLTLPSQEVSSATQTLAAAGVNVPLAGYFVGANLPNASRAIADAPVGSGPYELPDYSFLRPDLYRAVQPNWFGGM